MDDSHFGLDAAYLRMCHFPEPPYYPIPFVINSGDLATIVNSITSVSED